ncbi:MAG TPA: hypothetical protein VGL51_10985 [Solirubrobacteraceae bacterium]|jgi:uncharacterized membrane protein
MLLVPAVAFSDFILAIHILAVVIAFGATFAYPILFASANRLDPTVLPWLFRTMQRISRTLVNPGLLVVLLAGIYLASDRHQWGNFYVQWGIAAVIVIGAIEGSFMIPREGRMAELAERDLASAAVPAGGQGTGAQRTSARWSQEYNDSFRRLALGATVLDLIVVVTVFIMAARVGA